jgi:hypothetical protein
MESVTHVSKMFICSNLRMIRALRVQWLDIYMNEFDYHTFF